MFWFYAPKGARSDGKFTNLPFWDPFCVATMEFTILRFDRFTARLGKRRALDPRLRHHQTPSDTRMMRATLRLEVLHVRDSFEETVQDPHWPDLRIFRMHNASKNASAGSQMIQMTQKNALELVYDHISDHIPGIQHIRPYVFDMFPNKRPEQRNWLRIRCRPPQILSALAGHFPSHTISTTDGTQHDHTGIWSYRWY